MRHKKNRTPLGWAYTDGSFTTDTPLSWGQWRGYWFATRTYAGGCPLTTELVVQEGWHGATTSNGWTILYTPHDDHDKRWVVRKWQPTTQSERVVRVPQVLMFRHGSGIFSTLATETTL